MEQIILLLKSNRFANRVFKDVAALKEACWTAWQQLTDQPDVISRVMHQLHTHRRLDLHQLELTTAKRMKRVRHPDEPPLDVSKGCS